ncbi:MBL fold metallo-hydrolase [Rhodococcus sp. NPDC056960]|uniref:MBL fold metallo-hydrolase n=1 Tax=Rhodococcus sp. NPDC056960 TaxID=3345982 RepID=UPI00362995EA
MPSINRRSLLIGLGALTATAGLTACSTSTTAASDTGVASETAGNGTAAEPNLELILLGTQAGPPIQPDRAGISTALTVAGRTYLVDCGRKSTTQYVNSGLTLRSLDSIFITHLHADHVSDYYNYFLLGGMVPNSLGDNLSGPVKIYGPGPAGGLPERYGGGVAPVVSPNDPTPGIGAMTSSLHDAYAYSSNVFLRDTGIRDIRTLTDVREIALPEVGSSYTSPHPDMDPFVVMTDDRVTVSATLVPHGPVYPAFAFRFDTEFGSVTFSGDTTYSENLIKLATGTDVLVHEAINVEGADLDETLKAHLLEGHVEVQQVGSIAERCGASQLVLSHIGDMAGLLDDGQWKSWASQGYSGSVTVGHDLQRIRLA